MGSGPFFCYFCFKWVKILKNKLLASLEISPIIAAVRERFFSDALESPSEVIFLLGCDVLTVADKINSTHDKGKYIFVHIDLCDGIGKDKSGIRFLANLGVDGIISTKSNLIKYAKEQGLLTVQRFFAYDSHGIEGIGEVSLINAPDFIEIMPGVIGKITKRFSKIGIPLISGGLIETKTEVTDALKSGAFAISTGKHELWYI